MIRTERTIIAQAVGMLQETIAREKTSLGRVNMTGMALVSGLIVGFHILDRLTTLASVCIRGVSTEADSLLHIAIVLVAAWIACAVFTHFAQRRRATMGARAITSARTSIATDDELKELLGDSDL